MTKFVCVFVNSHYEEQAHAITMEQSVSVPNEKWPKSLAKTVLVA